MASPSEYPQITSERSLGGMAITALAALFSLAALGGSLYLSMGMGLRACPFCFYQRTLVMGVVAILWLGLLLPGIRASALNVLALPLAVGGLAIAGWHCYLECTGVMECPAGVFALGTAPQQSLASYVAMTALIALGLAMDAKRRTGDLAVAVVAVVLGALFAVSGIRSSPKSVGPDYTVPVDQDGCRKPMAQ